MSKEYPMDRKLQNAEDQDRMSRILKRRAEEASAAKKTDSTSEKDESSTQSCEKARAAGSSE
jgi:hypothetical protein